MESSILSMGDHRSALNGSLFNQTVSVADLTSRPGESFQVSEDKSTTQAYSLYHEFLNAFQEIGFINLKTTQKLFRIYMYKFY